MYFIYGKSNCPYCHMAKALLDRKGIPYKWYNIETDEKAREVFSLVFPNAKTVPQILNSNEIPIGGYTELEALLRQ